MVSPGTEALVDLWLRVPDAATRGEASDVDVLDMVELQRWQRFRHVESARSGIARAE